MTRRIALAFALLAASASLQAATLNFSFERTSYRFNEGDGTATINVLRGGDVSSAITITYGWGIDLIFGSVGDTGVMTFAAGETSKTLTITIPNDSYYTGGTSGGAALYNSPLGYIGDQLARTNFTVVDDEPTPTITGTSVSVAEGNSGVITATLHFKLSAPIGKRADAYYPIAGTATRDVDFISPYTAPLMALYQTEFDVDITIKGDLAPEPDETIIVSYFIQLPAGGLRGEGQITILNDEYLMEPPTQQIDLGTSSSVVLSTSVPSPSTDHILLWSDEAVVTVPPFVDVPAGGTTATIPITSVSAGVATIVATLPASRGNITQTSSVTVSSRSALAFDRPAVDMTIGTFYTATAHLTPPPAMPLTLPIRNSRPSVTEAPSTFTIGTDGIGTFRVRALEIGGSTLAVTLPFYYGGETSAIQVDVAPPAGLAITALSTTNGPGVGNELVTISGQDIKGRCTVTFGGVSGLNTAVAANGKVTTYTPPHAAGAVDVAIRCGTAEFTFANAYAYTASTPRITLIAPATGGTSGGTIVRATGENLPRGRCGLWFGDSPATTLQNLEKSEMTAIAPPHASGVVAVTLRCGSDVSTLKDAYVYTAGEPLAEIAAVNPSSAAPGERVTIGGSGFRAGDTIAFGGIAAIDMTAAPNAYFVTVPEIPAGPATVSMRDAGGRTITGPPFAVKPPAPTQLTSAPAKVTAGSEIVVNGSGFRHALSFVLGGVTLRPIVIAPTYAVLGVPKSMPPQTTTFAVANASGATLATRAMEVTASGVAVESASPQCVSTEGGVLVTINGSGFVPGAVVTFGIADGTDVVVRDSHTIVTRAPASSGVSDATITVTNPSLESGQLTKGFQYRWPDSACGGSKRRAAHH